MFGSYISTREYLLKRYASEYTTLIDCYRESGEDKSEFTLPPISGDDCVASSIILNHYLKSYGLSNFLVKHKYVVTKGKNLISYNDDYYGNYGECILTIVLDHE